MKYMLNGNYSYIPIPLPPEKRIFVEEREKNSIIELKNENEFAARCSFFLTILH